MKKIFLSIIILPLLIVYSTNIAAAETIEVTVTGNGSDSENNANVNSQQETSVSQTNQADVSNNVETDANTGGNEASGNTGGENNIVTGDIDTSTSIENEVNSNTAAGGCGCPEDSTTSVEISGNGSGSSNNAGVLRNNSTTVNQSNSATINNSVNTNANTGNNKANDNVGNIYIETGDITSHISIKNKNINSNLAVGFGNGKNDVEVKVSGNGENSENDVWIEIDNIFNYNSSNEFNLTNLIWQNLNTGGNEAKDNVGDVSIITGDIDSIIEIANSGNNNHADFSCPKEKENPGNGEEVPTPSSSGSSNNGGGGNNNGGSSGGVGGASSGGGTVLAAAAGEILPITGTAWLFIATLLASLMLLMGWFLRFSSGASPPAVKD